MENFSNKVLEIIKQKAIKPRPKLYFWARDFVLWFLVVLSTFLGGLAFSLIILFAKFQQVGLSYPRPLGKLNWLLASIPYAWLIIFFLLISFIYFNLKHFRKSYKYPAYLLILTSLFGSVIIGFITVGFDGHRQINEEFSRRVPFYGPIFDARLNSWDRPNNGALAGKVESMGNSGFVLNDLHGHEWQIIFNDENNSSEKTREVKIGQKVIINGWPVGSGVFLAEEVLPWEGCRGSCHLTCPSCSSPNKPKIELR